MANVKNIADTKKTKLIKGLNLNYVKLTFNILKLKSTFDVLKNYLITQACIYKANNLATNK